MVQENQPAQKVAPNTPHVGGIGKEERKGCPGQRGQNTDSLMKEFCSSPSSKVPQYQGCKGAYHAGVWI
jgi:hypothetical protein